MLLPTTLRTALRASSSRASRPMIQRRSMQVETESWLEKNQGPLYIIGAILSLGSIYVLQPEDSWIKIGPSKDRDAKTGPPAGSAQDVMGGSEKANVPPPPSEGGQR